MSKKKLKIGIITHNYPKTNKERKDAGIFIFDFAHKLSKKFEVFILSPDFKGEKQVYKTVPVTWFFWRGDGEKFGGWSIFSPSSILKFVKLLFFGKNAVEDFIRDNNLDYLLACWGLPSGVLAFWGTRKTKTHYAIWSLGSDINKYANYPFLASLMRRSYSKADMLFANSQLLCNKIEKLYNTNCTLLPAVTDFSKPKLTNIKIDKSVPQFLFVGRLEKVKGPDILIEGANLLNQQGIEFMLHIIGDGSMKEQLEEMVKKYKLKRKVQFLGFADKNLIASYMKKVDYLVIASRSESLPLVLIEAASCNLPVIASDVGDCRRIVEKYKVGDWFPSEDVPELCRALKRNMFINSSEYRKNLSDLLNDYSQSVSVGKFIEMIQKK